MSSETEEANFTGEIERKTSAFIKGQTFVQFVGFLTFISMTNTTSEISISRKVFNCQYFSFLEQLKFHAQLSMKKQQPGVLKG